MRTRILTAMAMAAALVAACDVVAGPPKRGWGGSDANDHNASNSSWYYRWWHTIPPDGVGSLAEFVPLIKFPTTQNLPNNLASVASLPNVDTLLVLNEPERSTQSDRTVAEALSYWPTIQQTLPNHRLVGPGVGDDAGGRAWIADFMTQVDARNGNADPNDDIRVDAIAFHWYGASEPNPVAAANNFMSRVEFFHTEYNRPVWITEFAMHDWEGNNLTEDMIAANAEFLDIVLPQLDALPYVERYAYYNWFDDAHVWVDDPRRLPRADPNVPNPPPTDRTPTVIGDVLVGTTGAGEVRDLLGVSIGTDIGYLRGGEITNTGATLPEAMRALDALEGVNTISGSTDWSLSARRDNFTRVRQGATLRKTGANTIGLTGVLELDGALEVAEGTLRFAGNSPSGAGGAIRVAEGATLQLDTGRVLFSVTNRDVESHGTIDGAIRFSTGSTARPLGVAPVFTDDVTVAGATFEVGGAGFTVATPTAPSPVTTQLRLEYDAAADTPGDNVWEDARGSADAFTFGGSVSPQAVNDEAFPGLSSAYAISQTGGADGLNGFFENGAPRSKADATFELVFRIDDLSAGADQVLLEAGGAGRGIAFVLNDNTLTFNVDGDDGDINLNTPLAAGWHHAIGVIDLDTGGDSVQLFVNGQSVGVQANRDIFDWAGGNLAGLGAGASSVTGVSSGVGSAFHGALALARYYEGFAFDDADALQNYQALTAVPDLDPTTAHVGGDFSVQAGSDVRLDIGDAAAADKIAIDGTLAASGGTLSVTHVGQDALVVGDRFDLFDFASASISFDDVSLPPLEAALGWRLDGLAVDGSIEVVLAGDLNGDGSVDVADYTVWRDSSGQAVDHYTSGDATGDGFVDDADYDVWRANFGSAVTPVATTVPEPQTALAVVMLFSIYLRSRR